MPPIIRMATPGGRKAPGMYKIVRVSLTALVFALLMISVCESAPKKPVAKRPVAAKPVAKKPVVKRPVAAKPVAKKPVAAKPVAKKPVAAKPLPVKAVLGAATQELTVVAGQPFETVPTNGPSKVAIALCPEETAAATFTVRCGKPLKSVRVVAGDFTGPGKIVKASVTVRMVSGQDLLSCDSIDIGSTPVQLWVNIAGPKDAKAGIYVGAITFTAQGKVVDRVLLQVAVLPLRLLSSSRQYALYTTLGPGAQGSDLSGDAYARFLASAARLGFRAVSVNSDPGKVGEAFSACASAGLLGTAPVLSYAWGSSVPALEQFQAIEDARKSSGLRSVYCFCASNPSSEAEVSAALARGELLRRARAQVAATVSDDATLQKLMPVLDGVNYKIDMPYVQALIGGGSNRTTKWEWYWWDARQSAAENRFYAGVALWRSGLYGCMPFWMPKGPADKADSLDNLQCEALREGINDTRYITTYMKALRELKDKKREPDKEYIASTEEYLSGFLSRPIDRVTPADLRAFRSKMTQFSIKLAAML